MPRAQVGSYSLFLRIVIESLLVHRYRTTWRLRRKRNAYAGRLRRSVLARARLRAGRAQESRSSLWACSLGSTARAPGERGRQLLVNGRDEQRRRRRWRCYGKGWRLTT
eukprot:5534491-Prymnesium_polylepis.1